MKINEKNLVYFASSETPIDKEGWLLKRGEVNKNFQKRWFILKGNLLFYFERKADKEPVGVIILEGCTIELAENEDQYTFKVVFHGMGGRTYVLGADTQETMESWMKVLACAGYDYMKVMVAELQRQVDELTAAGATGAVLRSQERINPFDRRNADESPIESEGRPRSVPNTPTPTRPAPPPPPQATSSHAQHRHNSAEPDAADNSTGVSTPVVKKTFRELHDEYGVKIKRHLRLL